MNRVTRSAIDRRLSIAPMLDYTDRFCRYFLRLISRHTLLYTEMVTSSALLHGNAAQLLRFDPAERPLALQIGGSEPREMAACAALGEDHGYDEIDMNVGCPSDRVQSGRFGACLMASPRLVADCVAAMRERVAIPVTVKTRIGIDRQDSYAELAGFVATVASAGCRCFVIHARKAWLQGLSPKQNRDIPPLRYDRVERLKQDFPQLEIVVNGGISSLDHVQRMLARLDGAMIGREAYRSPWLLAEADRRIFGDPRPTRTRRQVLEAFLPFVERQLTAGVPLARIARPILGLFQGRPGARAWRRHLSEHAHRRGAGAQVILAAARHVAAE